MLNPLLQRKPRKNYFTPKEHILLHHYYSFASLHGSIGLFSEQGFESMHKVIKVKSIRYSNQRQKAQVLSKSLAETLCYII